MFSGLLAEKLPKVSSMLAVNLKKIGSGTKIDLGVRVRVSEKHTE